MRTAIYARISNDKAGAGLGVGRQEAECREVCERLGWNVSEVYADNDRSAYSGKRRPGYERMLDDARAGRLDAIVAWHTDRLHRSPRELETFIEIVEAASIRIETARTGMLDLSTPGGRMVARQLGAVARYESEHKSDRQKAKALELARLGKPSGGGDRPFGYEPDRVTIRPDEAVIVQEVVQRFLSGEAIRGLCADLNKRAVRTTRGNEWKTQVLRRLIASPRISGQREHHDVIIGDAVWPAIITPEQTARVRAILADPSRRATRAPRSYLLKGLVRCGRCDAVLVGRPREDGSRRYVCAAGPNFLGCGGTYALAEPLERFVTAAALDALDSANVHAAIHRRPSDGEDEWQTRADQLTRKLDDLAATYAAERIDMREWLTAREPLRRQLDEAQMRLARAAGRLALVSYAGRGVELATKWSSYSIDRQRAVIESVLFHVVAHPGRRGLNKFDPGRFALIWRH